MNLPWKRCWLPVLALSALVAGCKGDGATAPPVGETTPARRAATSFVHCVEQNGGMCVRAEPKFGSWDAFAMLGWLSSGAPTSILAALPRELQRHQDPRLIQIHFVNQVDRNSQQIRGAECHVADTVAFSELLPKLRMSVEDRMKKMGLWGTDLQRVVEGLDQEAREGLVDGYLVAMQCETAPYELYVATASDEERFVVVGMLVELPGFLGGEAVARDSATLRLRPISLGRRKLGFVDENAVDPYVQIPVEEF